MNSIRPQRIYLLRHGAIQGFERKTYFGRLDLPLRPQGVAQGKAWHRFFQDDLPGKIFCSDLKRCIHTANIIAGPLSDRILAPDM